MQNRLKFVSTLYIYICFCLLCRSAAPHEIMHVCISSSPSLHSFGHWVIPESEPAQPAMLFVYYSISLFLETETHYTATAMSEIIHRQCFYIVMPLCIVLAFVQHLNYFYCIYFKMMNTLKEKCKAGSAAAAAVCSSAQTENKFKSIGYWNLSRHMCKCSMLFMRFQF